MSITPSSSRRVFRPFGAHYLVDTDDRRAFDACAHAIARYPANAGVQGTYQLTVRTGRDAANDPAWPATSVSHRPGRLELHCGSATLTTDAGAGTAEALLPPSLLAVPDAVRMVVEGALSSLLIDGGQLHALHAGLVQYRGRSLLLRGPSGAGKSTLTYACLRAGFQVISDDWVYAVAGQPATWLWGYPWRIFLVPEATERFVELSGRPPVLHPGADVLKVPIEPSVRQRRRGARPDAVVLLDPDARLELRQVDPAEAAERFWGPALPTERRDLPSEWVDALLDRPCYVLQRGTEPQRAVELLAELARAAS